MIYCFTTPYLSRPAVAGGPTDKTKARYQAVFDKFAPFAASHNIITWSQVTDTVVSSYMSHLEKKGYEERTLYLEGTTLKQVVKYLVGRKRLPTECLLNLKLRKPHGTTTYCWRSEEVVAMIALCQRDQCLHWMADLVLVLCQTGMRISELAALRWSDLDFERKVLRITNDRRLRGKASAGRRRTKSGRDRCLPLTKEVRDVIVRQPHMPDGFAFHGPRGGRLKADRVRHVLVTRVIKPLAGRFPTPEGEVGFRDGRLHSCRHYFASRCANEGVPERALRNWLGHASGKMISIYYHLRNEEAQAQMARVDFTGDVGGNGAAVPSLKNLEAPRGER